MMGKSYSFTLRLQRKTFPWVSSRNLVTPAPPPGVQRIH
jgi:hypothetical protein